jgi:hypothetical protein
MTALRTVSYQGVYPPPWGPKSKRNLRLSTFLNSRPEIIRPSSWLVEYPTLVSPTRTVINLETCRCVYAVSFRIFKNFMLTVKLAGALCATMSHTAFTPIDARIYYTSIMR